MEEIMKKIMDSLGIPLILTPEMEAKVPAMLKLPPQIQHALALWMAGKMQILMAKKIAPEVGWARLNQLHWEAFDEMIELILSDKEVKPLLDMVSKWGGNLSLAAHMTIMFDAFMGNTDEIVEASPERVVTRNVDCYTWKTVVAEGIEKDYNCAIACLYGTKKVIESLSPNIQIEGEHDGSEIGIPGLKFNKCRLIGDDCCEMIYTLKKKP